VFQKIIPERQAHRAHRIISSGREILDVAHSLASARKEESEHSFKPVPLVSKANWKRRRLNSCIQQARI